MPAPDHQSRVTGQEAIIKVPNSGGNEIAVTNVSFSIDVNTSDVQTDQGLKPDIVTTGLRYSGSFEYDGAQDAIRDNLFYAAGDDAEVADGFFEPGEPKRVTMTVREERPEPGSSNNLPRTWTLENVVVTGMSRDIPSDDVASTSWDFEAEDAYVSADPAGDSERSG
jgi:hypothetical protein